MIVKHLEVIEKHFRKWYPKEGCGIIGVVKGKSKWFPCENLAEEEEDFVINPDDFNRANAVSDIIGIVHSHVNSSPKASYNDRKFCNVIGIPYYIFSYPNMELEILKPKKVVNELAGREYEFGVFDCLEAVRDFYTQNLSIELRKRVYYLDDWWEKDTDYFTSEHIKEWGFRPVDDLKENDVLIFSMGANIGTHCGVYLYDDIFFHHAVNRLSCKENLYPLWRKHLSGIYRYDS
jgi:proteasome lid subunit RPN8/RPN11